MDAKKYLKADFLDILFEGRNKTYGAYELRRGYDKRAGRAVVITIILLLLVVGAYALSNYISAHKPVKEEKPVEKTVKLEDLDIEQPDLPPPPPPPPAPEPPKVKTTVKYTPPKVVEDDQVPPDMEPPDMSKIKDKAIGAENIKGDPNGVDPGLVKESGNGVTAGAPGGQGNGDAHKVFQFVEQMPQFPGGESALMKYLSKHINYPSRARENNIQGVVVVQFVVNTDGTIVDVKPVGKKKGGGLEEEAVRVVKGMPNWTPGKQNGRAVRVQYSLPIRFTLQ